MASIKKYTTKNGQKRYMFRMYLGVNEQTGQKKQTTRRGFKTQKEAKLEIARLQLQIDNGDLKKVNNITFLSVYQEFMDSIEKSVKGSTYYGFKSHFHSTILPFFGNKRIRTITPKQIQNWLNDLSTQKRSFSHFAMLTKRVFEFAHDHEYIERNPFELVNMPRKKEKSERDNYYNQEELIHFLELPFFKEPQNYNIYVFFRLLAFSGIRKGEALALKWSDVDFQDNLINITKTVSIKSDGTKNITTPKTQNSIRKVSLDEITISILKKWKLEQRKWLLWNGINNFRIDIFLFSQFGNVPYTVQTTNFWLKKVYKQSPSIKQIRVHGFRHTHASMLFSAGISVKQAQMRLGHSSSQITLDVYTHLSHDQSVDVVEKLSKFANF